MGDSPCCLDGWGVPGLGVQGLRPPWHPWAGAKMGWQPPGVLARPQGLPMEPSETPTDCALSFQILGAVILGFGVWILADRSSFISVLRKDPSDPPTRPPSDWRAWGSRT